MAVAPREYYQQTTAVASSVPPPLSTERERESKGFHRGRLRGGLMAECAREGGDGAERLWRERKCSGGEREREGREDYTTT